MGNVEIEVGKESGGVCDCCGNETRTIWGYARDDGEPRAAYYVQWTRGAPQHWANFDFLIGTWGVKGVHDRRLVAWVYNPEVESFMLTDAAQRPTASSSLCAQALSRAEVLADEELLATARRLLDAVWLQDPRVVELEELGRGRDETA
jgi:hypothetical protein